MTAESLEVKVLMKKKKPELKEKCKKRGLKVSGNKVDLAKRIATFDKTGEGVKKAKTVLKKAVKEPDFDTETMELRFSGVKKIPYIQLGSGRFIFSINTEKPGGFKYIVFSGFVMKKWGRKPVNFTTTMKFTKIPTDAKKAIGNVTLKFLKRTFSNLTNGGLFPRENIEVLNDILDKVSGSDEDSMDDDPTANESFDDI